MAANPGEVPFDFGLVAMETYDIQRIADEVAWPLVNCYYREDYRLYSRMSHVINIDKAGAVQGENDLVDVGLMAYNRLVEDDTEDTETEVGHQAKDQGVEHDEDIIPAYAQSVVNLMIASIVDDERRGLVQSHALQEAGIDISDDIIDDFTFKTGAFYEFDSDGGFAIETLQRIENLNGEVIWYGKEDRAMEVSVEDDIVQAYIPEARVLKRDVELITAAVYVLGAPRSIQRAIEHIRATPSTATQA